MVKCLVHNAKGHDFDIAIGFAPQPLWSLAVEMTGLPQWKGVIEDTYRRYIIIRWLDVHTLEHEIGHAFVFSHVHSASGLMQWIMVELFPDVPLPICRSNYFCPADRAEVLKNKWRDFHVKPTLAKKDIEDPIEEE